MCTSLHIDTTGHLVFEKVNKWIRNQESLHNLNFDLIQCEWPNTVDASKLDIAKKVPSVFTFMESLTLSGITNLRKELNSGGEEIIEALFKLINNILCEREAAESFSHLVCLTKEDMDATIAYHGLKDNISIVPTGISDELTGSKIEDVKLPKNTGLFLGNYHHPQYGCNSVVFRGSPLFSCRGKP